MKDSGGVEYIPGAGSPRMLKGLRVYLNAAGEAHFAYIESKDPGVPERWLLICPHCNEPYWYVLVDEFSIPDACMDAVMREHGNGEFRGLCQHGKRLYGSDKRCYVGGQNPHGPECEVA